MSRTIYAIMTVFLVIFAVAVYVIVKPQKISMESLIVTPLNPYHYEFDGQFGNSRIDFYFVSSAIRNDSNFVNNIVRLVNNNKSPESSNYSYYSIYVYEKTDTLNEFFNSTAQELKSVYKENVVSYTRWNKNILDVFYIIESGYVVFDVLENKPISTEWQFE